MVRGVLALALVVGLAGVGGGVLSRGTAGRAGMTSRPAAQSAPAQWQAVLAFLRGGTARAPRWRRPVAVGRRHGACFREGAGPCITVCSYLVAASTPGTPCPAI